MDGYRVDDFFDLIDLEIPNKVSMYVVYTRIKYLSTYSPTPRDCMELWWGFEMT